MAYVEGYEIGNQVWNGEKFVAKEVETRGEISIATIDPKVIKDNHLKVGEVTPFTTKRIVD